MKNLKIGMLALTAALALSSNGALDLAGAQAAETPVCSFGESLEKLESSKRFSRKKIGKTFKLSRERKPTQAMLWVEVTEFTDKNSGRVYHANATRDDAYDGGNTVGWIEDVTSASDGVDGDEPRELKGTGEVVAEISDSWIECLKAQR